MPVVCGTVHKTLRLSLAPETSHRYAVIDAVVYQPWPVYEQVFQLKEVPSAAPANATDGLGLGADQGIGSRQRVAGGALESCAREDPRTEAGLWFRPALFMEQCSKTRMPAV